jgi:hypothetical protein
VEEQFFDWEASEQESHKIAMTELESQLLKVEQLPFLRLNILVTRRVFILIS